MMPQEKLKKTIEIWLAGYVMGVLTCIFITYYNNGIR
jgi:hypothetical protein